MQRDNTTTVSEQRLGKHIPAETNAHITIDLETGVFYVVRVEMLLAGQFEERSSFELCKGIREEMAL
jgi:hypothetical protein